MLSINLKDKNFRILLLIVGGILLLISAFFFYKYLNNLTTESFINEPYVPSVVGSTLTLPPSYNSNYFNSQYTKYTSDNDKFLYAISAAKFPTVYVYDNVNKGWATLKIRPPTVDTNVVSTKITCSNTDGTLFAVKNDVVWYYNIAGTYNNIYYVKLSKDTNGNIKYNDIYDMDFMSVPTIPEFSIPDKLRLMTVSNDYLFAVGCYNTEKQYPEAGTVIKGTIYYMRLKDGLPLDKKWYVLPFQQDPASIKHLVANDKNLYIYYYTMFGTTNNYNHKFYYATLPSYDSNPASPLSSISWETTIGSALGDRFFDDMYVNNYILWLADFNTVENSILYWVALDPATGKPIINTSAGTTMLVDTNKVNSGRRGIIGLTVFRKSLIMDSPTTLNPSLRLYNPAYDTVESTSTTVPITTVAGETTTTTVPTTTGAGATTTTIPTTTGAGATTTTGAGAGVGAGTTTTTTKVATTTTMAGAGASSGTGSSSGNNIFDESEFDKEFSRCK